MAYIAEDSVPPPPPELLAALLPIPVALKSGRAAEIVQASTESPELPVLHAMLNREIEIGHSYPYISQMTLEQFTAYFLSHVAFICREADSKKLLGMFYIKPNYPGRAGHICNGGFVTREGARGQGVCKGMGRAFLRLAKAIGYRAVMFNLVFVTNTASIHIWKSLGFRELSRIPGAGRLKGLAGYHDAIQFHYDLTADEDPTSTGDDDQQQQQQQGEDAAPPPPS